MAEGSTKVLDRLFRALASARRREILRFAALERCTVTQLADQLKMNEPAVSKHVRVLVDAALLSKSQEGRFRWCQLRRSALEPARESIVKLCCATTKSQPRKATRKGPTMHSPPKQLSGVIVLKRLKR